MQVELFLAGGEEIAITSNTKPVCNGGGLLGHPKEYLTLNPGGDTVCKYCGRRYVHTDHKDVEKFRSQGQAFAA